MKSHSTEGIRRWLKIGDYRRRKIGVVAVGKKDEYQLQGGCLSPSLTKTTKMRERGYQSDNVD